MARNDGVDRISARNVNLSGTKIGNAQRHNEREKESYTNPDIVQERSVFNIHFKTPTDDYEKMFTQMEADKVISTRGLKDNANLYGELIFDVNSAYFNNHGGYEFAKQFYADVYRAAVEIVGGEQYVLSAVMWFFPIVGITSPTAQHLKFLKVRMDGLSGNTARKERSLQKPRDLALRRKQLTPTYTMAWYSYASG